MIKTNTAFRKTTELEPGNIMDSFFKVINAGYTLLSDISQTKSWNNPNGNAYLYIYIKQGSMILKTDKKTFYLTEGYSCILPPKLICSYTFTKENLNEHYYVFFGGYGTKDILQKLKLDKNVVFFSDKNQSFSEKIVKIFNNFKTNKFKYNIINSGLFFQILTDISIDVNKINLQAQDSAILNISRKMQDSYMENISVVEYAKLCNLSKSNFMKKFKEVKNTTPQKYIANIKLNTAKELLETTNLSISEIAQNVGFNDAYYFSNFFKKATGRSPLNYKKEYFNKHK